MMARISLVEILGREIFCINPILKVTVRFLVDETKVPRLRRRSQGLARLGAGLISRRRHAGTENKIKRLFR